MLAAKLLGACGGEDKLFSDDVFQAFTRTGTGADTTVTTNIDMTKGYMLWSKGRSGATDHAIYDSARGVTLDLASNTTAAQTTQTTGLKAVSATGHTVGSLAKMNTSAATYVDFVFRKAPKFFDVVTFVAGSSIDRRVPHALGIAPGLIVLKSTATGSWHVYSKALDRSTGLVLNSNVGAWGMSNIWGASDPSQSDFGVKETTLTVSGETYVAYLFAHDASADGIIQCGSYVGNGSTGGPSVALGWEPQYLLVKSYQTAGNWQIIDNMRGMPVGSADMTLQADLSNAETAVDYVSSTATGFSVTSGSADVNTNGITYIYLAIRRPNKPPTTGAQVYNAIARTGTGAAATVTGVGFAPDLVLNKRRNGVNGYSHFFHDRLRGAGNGLDSASTVAEIAPASIQGEPNAFAMDGVAIGSDVGGYENYSSWTYINHFFKRAVGVFDQVCYTAGTWPVTYSHNLGSIPEMMIVKQRDAASQWTVYHAALGVNAYLALNTTATPAAYTSMFSVSSTTFGENWFGAGCQNVCYLFATKAGISKVGSYTGNGSNQIINCGFTTGARFILIKRTDAVGDWFVYDTVRGVIAGNDPHLSLNTTAAEITTDDSIDPDASGFIINQLAATNLNVTSATYIYLSFS